MCYYAVFVETMHTIIALQYSVDPWLYTKDPHQWHMNNTVAELVNLRAKRAITYSWKFIFAVCKCRKFVSQYMRRVHKHERNAHAHYKISLLSNFISIVSLVYRYVYICTLLNSMHMLVFCDRNSSAKKLKNFQHDTL